jgi:hypothetical protein
LIAIKIARKMSNNVGNIICHKVETESERPIDKNKIVNGITLLAGIKRR